MTGAIDSATVTTGIVANGPVAGDPSQVPRYAWSAAWMAEGTARPFLRFVTTRG
jgi:hypothetical protein